MAQFISYRPGIEVIGQPLVGQLEALGPFQPIALSIYAKHGIKTPRIDHWYPLQVYLHAFREIVNVIGEHTLFAIGKRVPEKAVWPPEAHDLAGALHSIDIAYHMNHRLHGEVMYQPQSKTMLEGIGHYTFRSTAKRRGIAVCDTPYPSEFDRGILTAVARRFEPTVEVRLDESQRSRKSGADSCTYFLEW